MNPLLPSAAALPAAPSAETGETPVAPAAIDPAFRAKAEEAAQKFEGFLIGEMLRQMRRSTRELASDDSPFKDRVNEDMLDLADTLVADAMAGQRAFGIADAILRQVLPEAASGAKPATEPERFKSRPSPVALDQQPTPTPTSR
ncbi:MAG TPA: flagellar biosynthesis protein FlgJ [Ideonella sp.]|nr:flagellar biosynthesis protein FlgJ [Ideonella sp.]